MSERVDIAVETMHGRACVVLRLFRAISATEELCDGHEVAAAPIVDGDTHGAFQRARRSFEHVFGVSVPEPTWTRGEPS